MIQRNFITTLLGIIVFSLGAYSQQTSEILKSDANSCEINLAIIQTLINDTTSSSARLFVVAHRGQNEKSRQYNYRRLYNAKALIIGSFGVSPEKVIFSEGEQSTGQGQVKFYLGNDLRFVVNFRRGADFCVTCCDFPYPCYYSWEYPIRKRSKKCFRLTLKT